jgi:tetratricopeptide (TPR) repeat protein
MRGTPKAPPDWRWGRASASLWSAAHSAAFVAAVHWQKDKSLIARFYRQVIPTGSKNIVANTGHQIVRLLVWVCLLVSFFSALSAPATDAAAFDSANKLYYEGKFADAAAAYDKLVQSGQRSAALYFNLGNAFFKSGQIGRAIAAYHQAQLLTPRDPDVRANLQFARNQVQGPTLQGAPWQKWLGRLSLNEWTLLAAASLWIFLLLLALLQWRPTLARPLRNGVLALGLATLLLCSCLGAMVYENSSNRIAIVVAPEAVVRMGPLDTAPNAFTIHDGAELRVLDQREDWLQVTTGPQRFGWVQRQQVVIPGV